MVQDLGLRVQTLGLGGHDWNSIWGLRVVTLDKGLGLAKI